MNFREIEDLLEKFYEGATTSAEEQQLRDFFTREPVPPHLASHADLFRYYEKAGKEELNDPEFERRFLAAIEEPRVIPVYSGRKEYFFLTGIAAAVLLLAGLVYTFRNDVFLRQAKNPADPEIAYQQVKNALSMVAANFNSGIVQVQKLDNFQEGLKKAEKLKVFQKGIDQMNTFSKYYQYQPIIMNPGDHLSP